MSGRKRIQVEESEWYRIQRQASQLKEVFRDLPDLIEDVRRQTRSDLDRSFAVVEERHRRTERLVSGLSEQTRRLETDTTRRLRAHAQQTEEALRATAGAVRAETREALKAQQEALRAELAAGNAAWQAETERLAQQLGAVTEDRERAAEVAGAWLADGRTMAALIRETLPHERYAPHRLAALEARLDTAGSSAAQGRFDAALALAQETYLGLSELRLEVSRLDVEHRALGREAVEALTVVERLVERGAMRPVTGEHGERIEGVTLDVDYWTHGELDALRQDVRSALGRARGDVLDTGQLRSVVDDEVPAFKDRLGDTVERARMRQLASQLRVNLADAVARTLDEIAGYELDRGEYADQDERESFYARLRHDNGNEIVVDIAPGPGETGDCVLRVLSYDHDVTAEAELRARAQAVRDALRSEGHDASPPVSEQGAPTVSEPSYVQLSTERPGRGGLLG